MAWQITALSLLLAAYAVITEIRLLRIRMLLHEQSRQIDGLIELVNDDAS